MIISTSDNEDRSNSDIPVFWDPSFIFNNDNNTKLMDNVEQDAELDTEHDAELNDAKRNNVEQDNPNPYNKYNEHESLSYY